MMFSKSIFEKIEDGSLNMSEFSKENKEFITALMKIAYNEGEENAEGIWIEDTFYSILDIEALIVISKAYNFLISKQKQ